MRHLPWLALVAALLVTGCAEDEDYAACPFDPCLYEQCTQQAGGSAGTEITYSCAVTRHPQCDQQICLRFEGSAPFCTEPCEPANQGSDCPGISTCEEYLGATGERPAVYYCVPNELPADDPNAWGECNADL